MPVSLAQRDETAWAQ